MVILSDQILLECGYLNKYWISTKEESGCFDLSDLVEPLIMIDTYVYINKYI